MAEKRVTKQQLRRALTEVRKWKRKLRVSGAVWRGKVTEFATARAGLSLAHEMLTSLLARYLRETP